MRLSKNFVNYFNSPAVTRSGYSLLNTFSFHLQPENHLSLCKLILNSRPLTSILHDTSWHEIITPDFTTKLKRDKSVKNTQTHLGCSSWKWVSESQNISCTLLKEACMLDLNSVAKPSANEINNEHKKLQFTKFLVSISFHFPLGMLGFPRASSSAINLVRTVITGKSQTETYNRPWYTDRGIARSIHQGLCLRFPCNHRTDEVNTLFIIWPV